MIFEILDASATPTVTVNAAGLINYANPQAVRDFGYALDELVGRPIETLMPLENAQRHVRAREQYLEDAVPRAMGSGLELAARRKDGSTFPVEISLTPLPTDDGPWVLAGIVDISARRAAEDRLQALSDAHLALAELNAAILRVDTADELYDAACHVVGDVGDELGVWIAKVTGTGGLRVVVRHGAVGPVADDGGGLLTDLPALVGVVADGLTWLSGDIAHDTTGAWRSWALEAGVLTVAGLPLRRGGRTVAVMVLHATRPELGEAEFVSVLMTLAGNLSFALDRFEAQDRMHRIDGQRLELLSRLVAAQEQERARIAGDVHDHSIQALAAVDLRLGMHARKLAQVAPELVESVETLHAGLAEVISELRHLLFDLESADEGVTLVDQLHDALDHVFEDPETQHALDVELPELADLSPDLRVQAVRIFKEALSNVRRHAHATSVRVTVRPDATGVEVAVSDNGVGPPVDAAQLHSAHGHRGLDGMRDRAAVAGGWCRFERADGHTVLRFWLPREGSGGRRS